MQHFLLKGNINNNKLKYNRLQSLFGLIVAFLLIASVSIRRDGRLWGHSLTANTKEPPQVESKTGDTLVINTTEIGKNIIGYNGPVPLEIFICHGRVVKVVALPNAETPGFFARVKGLLNRWNGLTVEEALALDVDAVAGATFSSNAVIGNMRRGLQQAQQQSVTKSVWNTINIPPQFIIGLVVVLMAAILPLLVRNKTIRIIQMVLNVIVLGFWCGAFISYASLVNYMSNGMNVIVLAVPFVMLVTAFVYPLFGRKAHYCSYVCPFGSLQQLVGMCVKYKLPIKPSIVKILGRLRQGLWAVLMLCMWCGVLFKWMDYELFSAFLFGSASWVVIAVAVVFVLLSAIVNRPYCHFVCPTGTLLRISEWRK